MATTTESRHSNLPNQIAAVVPQHRGLSYSKSIYSHFAADLLEKDLNAGDQLENDHDRYASRYIQ
jgi:hypothetical protein